MVPGPELYAGFNSRLRAGGEGQALEHRYGQQEFQSTPPRGRRVNSIVFPFQPKGFQSTPPRGRRGSPAPRRKWRSTVSIHASAREARLGRL